MARFSLCLLTTLAAIVGACARAAAPVVTAPRYPDYLFPTVPTELAASRGAAPHARGWQFLQAGDLSNAERQFTTALRDDPAFYPAETGIGYVDLARQDYEHAVVRFGSALAEAPQYVPALIGRGEALLASARSTEALRDFEAALAADPTLADARRRVEVLRFRYIQDAITAGRRAADAGQFDEARAAFARAIAAAPDSPSLYRELATVESRAGDVASALAHATKAEGLDGFDARTLTLLGELYEGQGDLPAAEQALARAFDLDPNDDVRRRLDDVRGRLRLSRLPREYGAIPGTTQITRGELAALIGVRLENLLEAVVEQPSVVVTDTRQHWAARWIPTVLRAGVMEAYPNHTFQPGATIRRGDLALVVSRLLALTARRAPGAAARWRQSSQTFADLPPGHLSHPAAAIAVAAGVLPVLEGNTFQLARPVSGAEAVAAIDRIEKLADETVGQ